MECLEAGGMVCCLCHEREVGRRARLTRRDYGAFSFGVGVLLLSSGLDICVFVDVNHIASVRPVPAFAWWLSCRVGQGKNLKKFRSEASDATEKRRSRHVDRNWPRQR